MLCPEQEHSQAGMTLVFEKAGLPVGPVRLDCPRGRDPAEEDEMA